MNTTYADKRAEAEKTAKDRKTEIYLEAIREMTLMTDEFMNIVFPDKRVAELVLRVILQKELTVMDCKVQHEVTGAEGRTVRFDVFAVDNDGRRYNIEVQNGDKGAEPKRARLNCAYMDSSALKKGQEAKELPETYVIFITKSDYLKGGLPIYNIEQVIMQTNALFNSGLHIVYVNSEIQDDTPLGKLMQDFRCKEPQDANYEVIKEKLKYFKHTEEGVSSMSEIMQRIYDEGRAEEKKDLALRMIEDKVVDDNIIAKYASLSIEEVRALRQGTNL